MTSVFHITHLNFILCLFFVFVVTEKENVQYYDVNSIRYINLKPFSIEAIIKTNGTMFMKAHQNIENAYTFGIINYSFIVQIDSKTINLKECISEKNIDKSFKKPFVVVFHRNGLLKHIIVDKNEEDLSVNMKLIFSSMVQIENKQLSHPNELKYTVNTTEPLIYGTCDVTYNINKIKFSSNLEALSVRKTFNMNSCSQLQTRDTISNSEHFSECSNSLEENFEWKINTEMEIENSNNISIWHTMKYTEHTSQIPLKDRLVRLTINQSTTSKLRFIPLTESALEMYDVNNAVTEKIRFGSINHSIFQESSSTSNRKLRRLYKALVCDKSNQTIYLDIIEYAIICNAE